MEIIKPGLLLQEFNLSESNEREDEREREREREREIAIQRPFRSSFLLFGICSFFAALRKNGFLFLEEKKWAARQWRRHRRRHRRRRHRHRRRRPLSLFLINEPGPNRFPASLAEEREILDTWSLSQDQHRSVTVASLLMTLQWPFL